MVESDPQTYEDASNDPIWQASMKEEFISLQKINTWELVDLLPGRKLVQCKWVYKTKFAADGSPLKYKSILVAKSYSQVHGIDYNERLCTSGKDGLHQASFSHCSFKVMRGTSHGCKVCLPKWRSH